MKLKWQGLKISRTKPKHCLTWYFLSPLSITCTWFTWIDWSVRPYLTDWIWEGFLRCYIKGLRRPFITSSICFAKPHATFAIRLAGNINHSFTDMRFMTRGRFSVYVSVHCFCTSYPGVCCKKNLFRNGSPGNPFMSNVSRKYYEVKFA